ncbi:MAG: hypothetical protein ACERKN_17635 [Velocimicrobium sp.]
MDDFEIYNRRIDSRNIIRVEDAFIEEILTNNRTCYVTISYGVMDDFSRIHMELLTLIVNQNTVIRNQFGQNLSCRELREGMIIDAEFSSAMTRSIPPQANAYRIIVKASKASSNVYVDRVLEIDTKNNFLYTGFANDISSQMKFAIANTTTISDRCGNQIRLRDIKPGQMVRVEHATFQTSSIPPQTTAFDVRVIT